MPNKDTRFCTKWLYKLDGTKNPCSRWLKQGKTVSTFLCTVCNEEKSCKNGGWSDVYKHSQRPKHLQCLKDVIESGQLIVTKSSSSSSLQVNTSNERALTLDEKVTRAEAYWAMATAKLGLSYNSSQYIQELFSQMFSDSNIVKEFSMKPRKLSYILSHGTGHYFTKIMLHDLMKAPGYTLIFDETITVSVRKQLDLHFRYWCERKQEIVVRYYKSIFLGHATAEILFRNMIDTLRADGIDIKKILMLGRDNPNVNKTVEIMMDQEIRLEREKQSSSTIKSNIGLIHIGSCPLHLIHNSFKIGMDGTNWSIEEFLNNLGFWFSRSPSRREDYLKLAKNLSNDIGKFIRRFIIIRWLDVGPIIERVIEQWTNLKEYFIRFIPTNRKISLNNHRYIQIRRIFETKSTLIRLNFLVFLYHNIYEQILKWFQQTQPLIHVLYDECEQLIRRLFSCFINEDLIKSKTLNELMNISFHIQANQKCDSELEIGEATRLDQNNLSSEENQQFFSDIRNMYSLITKELIRTLPLNNDLLRHLKCLHPIMRHSETSHISIMNIARSFPQMIIPDDIDRITAEWYIYQNENIPNEWYEQTNKYHSIDYYWKNVFTLKTNTGTNKFIALPKLIKCILALSHGNADVERGFSENAFLLTDDRSLLSDASINGLRATRDGVKFFGNGKPHEVPITKALLDCVRDAHSRYCIDLEKRQQELLTNKNSIKEETKNDFLIEKQNDLYDEQILLHKNLTTIQKMIDEGTERLTKAISLKDFKEIETSLLLIEGGNKKLATTNTHIVCNTNQLNQIRKKQKK
ncbi:unnamed protein product [Rotaria sp. Silwood1]|nr:unnamed protein product [Rotaria sp. Silwood1]